MTIAAWTPAAWLLWAASIGPVPEATVAEVTVASGRVTLGDLLPEMPAPWRALDLGPSPLPLGHRDIGAAEVADRVRRAHLSTPPMPVRPHTRVTRAGRRLSAPELQEIFRPEVERRLPPASRLRSLSVERGTVAGSGTLAVVLAPSPLRAGRQTLMARLTTGDGIQVVVPVLIDLDLATAAEAVKIERGQEVRVVVVVGSVVVRATGVAQGAGQAGDTIQVLPEQGGRVLRARVVDSQTVEVVG